MFGKYQIWKYCYRTRSGEEPMKCKIKNCIRTSSRRMHGKMHYNESKKPYWHKVCRKGQMAFNMQHTSQNEVKHLPNRSRQNLQPIRIAVAMVATVFGASLRFNMCPDIWFRSSTAYLNMKGTITLVIWRTSRKKQRLMWAHQMLFCVLSALMGRSSALH